MIVGETVRKVCRGFWFRVITVSLAMGLLVVLLMAPFRSGAILGMMARVMIHAAIMGGICALLVPRLFERIERWGAWLRFSVIVAALLALAVVGTLLARGVFALTGLDAGQTFRVNFLVDLRINALLAVVIGIAMTLYETQRSRLDALTLELRVKELEHEAARRMALAAQLSSLESRLQPHFLFNTLNTISALIQDDPERAERTVERLAALLRFSLDAAERGLVPLGQELRIARDYLEIEKTRLGERLAYTLDVTPGLDQWEVPPFSVQTLVENSVKHSIAPRRRGGQICVKASTAEDRVVLAVWDDGPGFSSAAITAGHGLDNLRGRLAGRFGERASVEVGQRDGGTVVTVSIPRNGSGAP